MNDRPRGRSCLARIQEAQLVRDTAASATRSHIQSRSSRCPAWPNAATVLAHRSRRGDCKRTQPARRSLASPRTRAHERRAHPERVPVSQIVSSRSPTGEGTAPDRCHGGGGPRHQSGRNTARAVEVQEDVTMETAGSNYVANVNLAWWLGGWMRALRRRARSRRRAGASCIVLAVGEQVGVGVGGLIGAPKSVDVGGDLLE